MEPHNVNILLIGAGNMGSALLGAWLRAGIKPQMITVVESNAAQAERLKSTGVAVAKSLGDVTQTPDCILLAVKPQSLDALTAEVASSSRRKPGSHPMPLYLSIAAGKTLAYFEKHLGDAAIVRAMPNTPALIGKGISALCANDNVSQPQKALATSLLQAAGEVVWVEDESLMDAVTAISGSGPAYVFLFMELLMQAGMKQGLQEDVCRQLVLHTFEGSAALALGSKETLATLRRNVTSPGGTTQAALDVLMKEETLKKLIEDAVSSAVNRSKELA